MMYMAIEELVRMVAYGEMSEEEAEAVARELFED